MADAYVGDTGQKIKVTVTDPNGNSLDISTTTLQQIKIKRHDGAVLSKGASFSTDGKDGDIEYVIEAGVYSIDGDWHYRGYCENIPGYGNRHTAWKKFEVGD